MIYILRNIGLIINFIVLFIGKYDGGIFLIQIFFFYICIGISIYRESYRYEYMYVYKYMYQLVKINKDNYFDFIFNILYIDIFVIIIF